MRENGPSGPKNDSPRRYGLIDPDDPDIRMLIPLPGKPWRYVRHDNHDTLVMFAAFGKGGAKPVHANLYARFKNTYLQRAEQLKKLGRGKEQPEMRQYRISNFARDFQLSDQTVRNALHDLERAKLIEVERDLPWQLSPLDGSLYRWVPGNQAEGEADSYVEDVTATLPESFRQAEDDLAAGLALVTEAAGTGKADEETTAKAAQMLAEVARLLRGEIEPPEPPGEDGPKPPKDPDDPHGHGRPESAVDDEAASPPLSGYAELAALDKRADRHKKSYQATAKKAYRKLLADDRLMPATDEIVAAYRAYEEGLVRDGKEKMRRPLAKWLTADDEYGAREGVRRIRKTAASAAKVPRKPTWPETVPCPRCGERARHLDGPVYQCSNLDCDFRDPFTISRHLIE